ncbi:low molecular weight protein-tyrosine-phosphatase [Haploplasma axanthum]|uniref:protein-tyrosine-phosphatase n=1 Tax=Haploplasma axanthum TaxID=29552 RepID=A0A449BDW5_HAPAX|nr:low molecular weight protein-tyrosine-phosphatase [Haploplasma axanthum]VEU80636.1 Low molecular weight protein-tyrosine-phosphatase yfkJ [Haploplasma axanthum]
MKVLFVCLGNICRSPMAEFMFKDLVEKEGLTEKFEIVSKATSSYEIGNDMYPPAKRKLVEKRIKFDKRFANQIKKDDFHYFDYIIGMDHQNIINLKRMAPKETENKIHLLLDINDETKNTEVPDPWYTDDFEETYNLLRNALLSWLERFKKEML